MDKALKKINKLKEELEKLYVKKDNVEDKIDFKSEEKKQLSITNYKLLKTEKKLINNKENIEYKQANLKKWKVQKIVTTLLSLLIYEGLIIGGFFSYLDPKTALIITLFLSSFAIPISISLGDINGYKLSKQYLKEHKLEDVESELFENSKELELNNKSIKKVKNELTNLSNEQIDILKNINLLKLEIEEINKIRITVISEYLKDNKDFDNLVNLKYQEQEKKKVKKKKDS